MTHFRYRAVARVCIELTSPLSIGSGEVDPRFDLMLVRDVNGLPAVPATSLAGVLRHAYQKRFDSVVTAWLFGKTVEAMKQADLGRAAGKQKKDYDASRLSITWAGIHNSRNQPIVDTEFSDERLDADPLLATLRSEQPQKRERVRLNHKGASAFRGKFDRAAVPAGCRFTFEVCLETDEQDPLAWKNFLSLLMGASLRLGGATRSGLGSIKVHQISTRKYDLMSAEQRVAFCSRSRDFSLPLAGGKEPQNVDAWRESAEDLSISLDLRPDDFWRVGQGTSRLGAGEAADKVPDLLQYTEQKVRWNGSSGSLTQHMVVMPASGIKGALAHRVAYHHRVKTGQWHDPAITGEPPKSAAVIELFGDQKDDNAGQAGKVFIDDIYLEVPQSNFRGEIWRNGIDRFSGGTRRGVLFGEESIYNKALNLRITVKDPNTIGPEAREAFMSAIDDLAKGRLALGAGASRGQGFFLSAFDTAKLRANWPAAEAPQPEIGS